MPATVTAPGFRLELDGGDGGLEVRCVEGAPFPEQVLRALHGAGVVWPVDAPGATPKVTLRCSRATDRAVYSADLGHRLVYRRTFDERGPVVTWFGINPFLADLEGDPARQPPRPSFRNIVGVATRHLGAVSSFTILNLFTRRSAQVVDIAMDPGDRLVHDDVVRDAVAESDLVIAAWGGAVKDQHRPQVRALVDLLDEFGMQLHVRARDGRPLMTSGHPPQPHHARMGGYKHLDLVPAPAEWIASLW